MSARNQRREAGPFIFVVMASIFCGCTHDFFFPTRELYRRPEDIGIASEWLRFPSGDGTDITGLLMKTPRPEAKGIVIQFHGNGENMTSHFMYSYWLPAQGYDVFIFDYRGYGASSGKPSVKGAVEDGAAAIRYVLHRKDWPGPVAVWGQSLGGAIAIASLALGNFSGNPRIKAVVIESSFGSYEDMAEDVLSRSWVTWPLRWPLSRLLISDRYAPRHFFKRLPPVPVLVIHGDRDRTVPYAFGQRLFQGLPRPKEFWVVKGGGHLAAFTRFGPQFKPQLVRFLDRASGLR